MLGPRALERRELAAHTGTDNYEDFFGGKYNIEVNPKLLSPKHLLNLSLISQPYDISRDHSVISCSNFVHPNTSSYVRVYLDLLNRI